MKIKLPGYIASIQDLHSLIDDLKTYQSWIEHEETKRQFGTKKQSPQPDLMPENLKFIQDFELAKGLSNFSIKEAIEALEKYSKSSPVINIILAAPAPNSLKSNIVSWCRKNLNQEILVNFQYNRSILGGMVIRFGSRIIDLSFRKKILSGQNKLIEAFNNVR